ncbi:MAG: AraC family transcriptional regulator [Pseudomonadota bacterium]
MLDLLLRGAALGVVGATGLILMLTFRNRGAAAIVTFSAMIGCYLAVSAPSASGMISEPVRRILIAGATLAPLGLTWMMMELLTDRTQDRRPWIVLAGLAAVSSILATLDGPALVGRGALVLAVYIGLVALAAFSDRQDLVTSRRRLRRAFLGIMGSLGIVISAVELLVDDHHLPDWVFLLQAAAILLLALVFAIWALRPAADLFGQDAPAKVREPAAPNPVIDRIEALMQNKVWQREGLTVAALADDVGIPEHKLRRTINRDLGYRNFSTFINGHRVEAAKSLLRDPDNHATTILEIAYECGFASLGPFNKAFRAQTGQSPREYRTAGTIDSE